MAGSLRVLITIVSAGLASLAGAQALPFPAPAPAAEAVSDTQDFPYLPPLPGARLIATKRINEPLELKQANEDNEAVLAGQSYVRKIYERPGKHHGRRLHHCRIVMRCSRRVGG